MPLSPRPLPFAIQHALPSRQAGFGLLGLMLVAGLAMAVGGVTYMVYIQGDRARQVRQESGTAQALSQRIQASYASAANFNGLNAASADRDGVFPKEARATAGVGQSVWGGSILVTGTDLVGPTGTPAPGQGFAITYEGVPAALCTRFASQNAAGFYDTRVAGQSVMTQRAIQMGAVVSQCAQAPTSTVQFLQARSNSNGLTNPGLTACVPPPPTFPISACPAGQLSSLPPYLVTGVTQQVDYFCNGAYGDFGTAAPKPFTNTCVPACVAPAPTPQSQTQTTPCAPGRVTPAGAGSFGQTQTRTLTYSCPLPIGGYATATPAWGPWSPLETAACAPQCVAPAATTATATQVASCPAGQILPSGASTYTQTRTQPVTYSCPAPTGGYVTTPGPWGAWSPASPAAAGCSPACVPLQATVGTQYQWVGVNAGCPAGYTGSHTYQKQQSQLVTTTYVCLSLLGTSVGVTAYGPWLDTGAIQADSNTCTAPPPPPPACSPPVGSLGGPLVLSNTLCVNGSCGANLGGLRYVTTTTNGSFIPVSASATVVWNLTTYTVTYGCSVAPFTGNTCTLALQSGSLPPGISMAGIGVVSSSNSANRTVGVGASFGAQACP